MKLDLTGTIKTTRRKIIVGRDECVGATYANKNKFLITISEKENPEVLDFLETVLHELLHLYFFIFMGIRDKKVSDALQHRVIDDVVPYTLSKIARELLPKRRRYNGKNS